MLQKLFSARPPMVMKCIVGLVVFAFVNQLAVAIYALVVASEIMMSDPVLVVATILIPLLSTLIYAGLCYALWIGHRTGFYGLLLLAVLTLYRFKELYGEGVAVGMYVHAATLFVAALLLSLKNAREYFGFK